MTATAVGTLNETSLPSDSAGSDDKDVRLIRRLAISGMLSFGPRGIDLPMEPLNVLIGANGSGKSNFIEALALLHAAPHDLSSPVRQMGGISEWLWKGEDTPGEATIEAVINYPHGGEMPLYHVLCVGQHGERFEVQLETISNEHPSAGEERPDVHFSSTGGQAVIRRPVAGFGFQSLKPGTFSRDASILSQREDPQFYPELGWLQQRYRQIRLYRNWEFGPDAGLRRSPRADEPSTFLTELGDNLPLVLSRLRGDNKQTFVKSLQQLYDGVEDFQVEVGGGRAELFLVEKGSGTRYVPVSRLSDGTLRYMAMAAILLDPEPPPLVVIEEPELGLHPDITLEIGRMLVKASQRTQLVVTTHSKDLVDALSDYPSSVVVCEKYDGESVFERLEPKRLTEWLERYSLGKLWSAGDLGGNRW